MLHDPSLQEGTCWDWTMHSNVGAAILCHSQDAVDVSIPLGLSREQTQRLGFILLWHLLLLSKGFPPRDRTLVGLSGTVAMHKVLPLRAASVAQRSGQFPAVLLQCSCGVCRALSWAARLIQGPGAAACSGWACLCCTLSCAALHS